MGTKANPQPNDCHANALPHEETFTLLARDPAAPRAIYHWIHERVMIGKNRGHDPEIIEARECAQRMEQQRESIRKELGKSKD